MRHLKLKIAYDGTDFHGWQVQPGLPTIQGLLEAVLTEIEGRRVQVHGAGRTDAGVHALAQVASVALSNPIPTENLRKAMNRLLPDAIRILDVEETTADFHPRHCARGKKYEYRIWRDEVCPPVLSRYVYPHPYPLDVPAMIEAATHFEGTRDFRSLAAANAPGKESTVRTIFSSTIERVGALLVYRVHGTGFLHHMVRNIVGVLLDVGRGARSPQDVDAILAARQRSAAGPTVPARGLFLVEVEYGAEREGQ
jgi:tRNA pseudouridine38-40 synthase